MKRGAPRTGQKSTTSKSVKRREAREEKQEKRSKRREGRERRSKSRASSEHVIKSREQRPSEEEKEQVQDAPRSTEETGAGWRCRLPPAGTSMEAPERSSMRLTLARSLPTTNLSIVSAQRTRRRTRPSASRSTWRPASSSGSTAASMRDTESVEEEEEEEEEEGRP